MGIKPRNLKLLFLHGFAGSPRELRPIGTNLSKLGFEVMAPLLPGHGERFPGMSSCTIHDWLGALRLTYAALRKDGTPVALVGYCLGGTLALAAARELNPRAVVCISTPVSALDEAIFLPTEQKNILRTDRFISDCKSEKARNWRKASCHLEVTRKFLATYQETIQIAATDLPEVRCPIAVVQSREAIVVPPSNAEQIASTHPESCMIWAEDAGHAVPIDFGRRRIAREIGDFLLDVEMSESRVF